MCGTYDGEGTYRRTDGKDAAVYEGISVYRRNAVSNTDLYGYP